MAHRARPESRCRSTATGSVGVPTRSLTQSGSGCGQWNREQMGDDHLQNHNAVALGI